MKILLAVDGSKYTKKMLAYLTVHAELFAAVNDFTVFTAQAPLQEIKTLLRRQGHQGLLEDGLIKASQGLTSIEEVMRVAYVEQDA